MTVTAKVSEVDYKKGYVKVIANDRDSIVSDWLPMMSDEYEMPDIGDVVTCDFTSDSRQVGFCKGRYFNDTGAPIKYGKDTYHKKLLKDADIEYDRAKKELIITVENIKILATFIRIKADLEFEGNILIEGDVDIKGSLVVDGSIHANGEVTSSSTITAAGFLTSTVPKVSVEEVNIT